MKKMSLLLLLISIASFSQNQSLEKKFDSILSQYKSADKPGLAAGVLQDGKLLYLKGFGVEDVETKKPITSKTKFQVEDLAKQFTVLSVLLLEKEGKLSLEDDIRKYLTQLPKYKHVLKIKHLINHTSGLYNLDPMKELLSIDANDRFTHEDAVNIISSQRTLNFKPGTQFSFYSSDSEIILLSEIVKVVSGDSFVNFTKEKVFKPLGMMNTTFLNNQSMLENMAKSYSVGDNIAYNPTSDFTLGINNLYTTAEDFSKWFQLYSSNHRLSSLVKKLDHYVKLDSGQEYASYWGKMTLGRYFDHPERGLPKMSWQFGLTAGYGANLFRFQSHHVISFVLGNNNRYNGMPAMLLANQIMEREYTEPPEIDYSKIAYEKVSSRKAKKFEGFYWDKKNSLVREIYFKNDTLRYKALNGNREIPLLAVSQNKFQLYVAGDTEAFVTFRKNRYEFSSLNSDPTTYDKVDLVDASKLNLSEYSGSYYNKELDVILNFSFSDNELSMSNFKTDPITFYPVIKDAFRSNTFIYSGVQFVRENNVVNGFKINTDGVVDLYFERIL